MNDKHIGGRSLVVADIHLLENNFEILLTCMQSVPLNVVYLQFYISHFAYEAEIFFFLIVNIRLLNNLFFLFAQKYCKIMVLSSFITLSVPSVCTNGNRNSASIIILIWLFLCGCFYVHLSLWRHYLFLFACFCRYI